MEMTGDVENVCLSIKTIELKGSRNRSSKFEDNEIHIKWFQSLGRKSVFSKRSIKIHIVTVSFMLEIETVVNR